ncbi:hypothetical protein [Pectobacterium aroidearum]|uniref:hypothetical protein n=1 Tax=Pectobacterium aroidearum TaxID=1201031 RepID=UPI0032F05A43
MKIYKYTPHISLFLRQPALSLTPTFFLNDPFEAKLTKKYKDKAVSDYSKYFNRDGKNSKSVERFTIDLEENGIFDGIISLTKKKADPTMMSHYADDHRGGFLEFTVENEISDGIYNEINLFVRDDIKYQCGPVIYVDGNSRGQSYNQNEVYDVDSACFEKSCEWRVEEEIRYVADYRKADFFLFSVKSLIEYYIHRDDNYIGYEINNGMVVFSYEDMSSSIIKLNPKPIRDVFFKVFDENDVDSYSYSENINSISFRLKNEKNYFNYSSIFKLVHMVKSDFSFHPMLRVNPDVLTGVYFGSRFDRRNITNDDVIKFTNLAGNIYASKLSDVGFSLDFEKINL